MIHGMTDAEMLDWLSADNELMDFIYPDNDPLSYNFARFPEVLWFKLRRSIEPFTRADMSYRKVVIC